jgi:hypothetical protein
MHVEPISRGEITENHKKELTVLLITEDVGSVVASLDEMLCHACVWYSKRTTHVTQECTNRFLCESLTFWPIGREFESEVRGSDDRDAD